MKSLENFRREKEVEKMKRLCICNVLVLFVNKLVKGVIEFFMGFCVFWSEIYLDFKF